MTQTHAPSHTRESLVRLSPPTIIKIQLQISSLASLVAETPRGHEERRALVADVVVEEVEREQPGVLRQRARHLRGARVSQPVILILF